MLYYLTVFSLLVFQFSISKASEPEECFDVKKYMEEFTSKHKKCVEEKANKGEIIVCIYKEIGIMKDDETFDMEKTKEHYLSRIANEKMKENIKKDFESCAEKDPKGSATYFNCWSTQLTKKCGF